MRYSWRRFGASQEEAFELIRKELSNFIGKKFRPSQGDAFVLLREKLSSFSASFTKKAFEHFRKKISSF